MAYISLAERQINAKRRAAECEVDLNRAVILYELGAFYEALGTDAKTVGESCDIIVSRRTISGIQTSIAGFPYHNLMDMIQELNRAGYVVVVDRAEENSGLLIYEDQHKV